MTVLARPRVPWAEVWPLMQRERASVLALVPAILELILAAVKAGDERTVAAAAAAAPRIEHVLVGGQSMGIALRERALRRFQNARFVQTYACTEACSSITFLFLGRDGGTLPVAAADEAGLRDWALWGTAAVGWPVPGARLAILDAQLRELPPGHTGQIATAGPHVMLGHSLGGRSEAEPPHKPSVIAVACTEAKAAMCPGSLGIAGTLGSSGHPRCNPTGYWRQPKLTKEALARGWLLTGDLGVLSADGSLHFAGRIKDLVKSGGENVPAGLVEQALLADGRIAQAAVFGLPDIGLGERVTAAVVPHADTLSSPELERQLWAALPQLVQQAGLAQYMRPRQLFLCRALPTTASGKVIKREIRRALLSSEAQPWLVGVAPSPIPQTRHHEPAMSERVQG